MDNETRDALELTRDDLLAMRAEGMPASVAKRPRDRKQLAKSRVDEVTEESGGVAPIEVVDSHLNLSDNWFEPQGTAVDGFSELTIIGKK